MNIIFSIISVVVVLVVVLPLFYIYIMSKARERLEKETISIVRDEINALVKEFNHLSLSNISLLENMTIRAKKILREVDEKEKRLKIKKHGNKNKEAIENQYSSYNQELNMRRQPMYSALIDEPLEEKMNALNKENFILDLYKLGFSSDDIAHKLNKPIGEVELILAMNLLDHKEEKESNIYDI